VKRVVTVLSVAAVVPVLVPTAVLAEPAQHAVYEESWEGTELLAADENRCGPWAATFHETREGSYRIVAAPGGQTEGEVHVNGAVDGTVSLTPVDPRLPSYQGSYREKANVVLTGVDEETGDDVLRVGQYRLRVPLEGSDGSRLVMTISGKVTMTPDGDLAVARGEETCAAR